MMMMIDFYERPDTSKRGGYYFGYEILRPSWVWHMYRDLEKEGVRFHLVMFGEEAAHVEARVFGEGNTFYYKEYIKCDSKIGDSIDQFIRNTKCAFEKFGTTIVEEPKNEDSISQSTPLPQLQSDQLDTPDSGTLPDRRIESGDGPSEHGGQDDTTGCDLLDTVRISP